MEELRNFRPVTGTNVLYPKSFHLFLHGDCHKILAIAVGLLLAGCAVGPDFHPPAAPSLTALTPEPIRPLPMSAVEQQAYVKGLEIPERWWALFRCQPLNSITAR